MKYLVVDISGKVLRYDIALCEALSSRLAADGGRVVFLAPNIKTNDIKCASKRLFSLVPQSLGFKYNNSAFKRVFKALEGVVNYAYLILFLIFYRVEILHLQWLPFLEVCSIERFFLALIKLLSPQTKIILTVHNLYPHNSNDSKKSLYRDRFRAIQKYIDKFVLHLENSRKTFCQEFAVAVSRTSVIPHGVFETQERQIKRHKRCEKLNLIMFGTQSPYKGTDVLVDALNLLPKEKTHTVIMGIIDSEYYMELKKKTESLDVEWIPERFSEELLLEKIDESDVIVVPYREISQSGVLLQSLCFKKPIIASDLPSFKETLVGFSDDMFFENGNARSLAEQIEKYIDFSYNTDEMMVNIENLCERYSWNKISNKMVEELTR